MDHLPPPRARRVGVGVAALLVAACGAPASQTSPSPATVPPTIVPTVVDADDVPPELLEPLLGLGPCEVEPNAVSPAPVEGLVLPAQAVVTSQSSDGPLTTVRGYVPATPVQAQVGYLREEAVEVLQAEHEVHESETLLASADHRVFVKVQAVCEEGSVFLAVVAPEASGASVPEPTGAPS